MQLPNRFFHTLTTQTIYPERFLAKALAEQALFNYLEAYYNIRKRYSANDDKSPVDFELEAELLQGLT